MLELRVLCSNPITPARSPQFHYVHHARFECNYGSSSLPLDNYFGTFRNQLRKPDSDPVAGRGYVRADQLRRGYAADAWAYWALCVLVFAVLGAAASHAWQLQLYARSVASLVAFGPIGAWVHFQSVVML